MYVLAQDTETVARRLAAIKGLSLDAVVRDAIETRAREAGVEIPSGRRRKHPDDVMRLIEEISARTSALPVLDDRTPDEIIGYDEFGVPR